MWTGRWSVPRKREPSLPSAMSYLKRSENETTSGHDVRGRSAGRVKRSEGRSSQCQVRGEHSLLKPRPTFPCWQLLMILNLVAMRVGFAQIRIAQPPRRLLHQVCPETPPAARVPEPEQGMQCVSGTMLTSPKRPDVIEPSALSSIRTICTRRRWVGRKSEDFLPT